MTAEEWEWHIHTVHQVDQQVTMACGRSFPCSAFHQPKIGDVWAVKYVVPAFPIEAVRLHSAEAHFSTIKAQ